ncbi:MAG: hypothetical protein ICV84_12280 [Flavisolibacter sp.]|nr:hypothetical protein [Flavisolibacter sp.]
MKPLFLSVCLLYTLLIQAQRNIRGLIKAEKSFAAYAVAHGTKAAFLHYLDSAGIIFQQGNFVNGIEAWQLRAPTKGVLNWQPQYAEIAASHDFGYTTGPWTFQPNGPQDTVAARGQYITIWHVNKERQWKVLIDLGISNTSVNPVHEVKRIKAIKWLQPTKDTTILMNTEMVFLIVIDENVATAYHQFLSATSILNRNGHLPALTQHDQERLIKSTPELSYTVLGSAIARSGDLGYVYGTTMFKNKQDGYLRIWRREKEGWKIALEVLRF